jgi:pimeloyl-ACP methyl ester carboxylesterase
METQIDTLERFDFGGPPQWALVRGRSRHRPVLLLIQAGPGFPMIHEAGDIERRVRLEEKFRVVYWDQRGTGKSFDSKDRGPLDVERLVGDIRSMVRALTERLGVSQIDVVGFSLGASLALLACAGERLPVRSLTCVGPDADLLEAERIAYAFALGEAERRGRRSAVRALRAIGDPPHMDAKRFMTRVKWVANFGGIHRGKDFGALLRTTVMRLWSSPHYGLREMLGALKAMGATPERVLPALQGFNLLDEPLCAGVPTIFFQGRHDVAAPPELTTRLARHVGAPLVWFDESAHAPHEEEPLRFREELIRFVSKVSEC